MKLGSLSTSNIRAAAKLGSGQPSAKASWPRDRLLNTMRAAITVGFNCETFIFLLLCLAMALGHGLRKRKKRPGWSNGAMISKRSLFVFGTSAAGCQLVELRLVMDSRASPVDVSGQERVRAELLRATPRRMPAEAQVFNSTETLPE